MEEAVDLTAEQAESEGTRGKGGRPRTDIWKFFTRGELNPISKKRSAKCQYCSKSWNEGAPRVLEKHIIAECGKVPQDVRAEVTASVALEVSKPRQPSSAKRPRGSGEGGTQTKLTQAFQPAGLSGGLKDSLDKALLLWAVQAGVPFNAFDHYRFKEFTKLLRFAYDPPGKLPLEKYLEINRCFDKSSFPFSIHDNVSSSTIAGSIAPQLRHMQLSMLEIAQAVYRSRNEYCVAT
jgi:hypothetical protein